MRLALISAKSINADFLNQIRYFSISITTQIPYVAGLTSIPYTEQKVRHPPGIEPAPYSIVQLQATIL